jgi:predicted nuclease of restriction endonuclease-like RecB superfamily
VLSAACLRYEIRSGVVEPSYLDNRHAELIRAIILRYEAFAGRPYRELEGALAALPEAAGHEPRLVAGLRQVIEERMVLRVAAPLAPERIREALFEIAAREHELAPPALYRRAAEALGIPGAALGEHLYADLRRERLVSLAAPLPPLAELLARYNFRLLQGLFAFADRVRIEVGGHVRAAYRLAKLHGLIVEVLRHAAGGRCAVLQVTGPLSLFQHTRKYGQALGRFLPACAVSSRYRIEARLCLRGRRALLVATEADRVLSSHAPPEPFDSAIEKRFHQDFLKLGCHWEIARETELILLGTTAFLPDFTFWPRAHPCFRVHLEIIGFWTRDYLARKQAILERLRGAKIIFCVAEKLCCERESGDIPFLRFQRRVPAAEVLELLEGLERQAR